MWCRIRGWSMATGGGCGVVAGVNTVLQGSVDGSCGGLRLGDCVQRLELRMVDTQRLELKLVDFGRWQLDGGGVVGRGYCLYGGSMWWTAVGAESGWSGTLATGRLWRRCTLQHWASRLCWRFAWASDGRNGRGLRRTVDDGECHVLNVVLRN